MVTLLHCSSMGRPRCFQPCCSVELHLTTISSDMWCLHRITKCFRSGLVRSFSWKGLGCLFKPTPETAITMTQQDPCLIRPPLQKQQCSIACCMQNTTHIVYRSGSTTSMQMKKIHKDNKSLHCDTDESATHWKKKNPLQNEI